MDPRNLSAAIDQLIKHDQEYQQIQEQIKKHDPAYLRIIAGLSLWERDELELYIAACEDAQYHRIYPAYRLGFSAGKNTK